ncbi:MAG: HU family DNA-binding protein [Clostridia bacterium]|nr:HU family DNA-binding protein [Clostridia bacterium]
MNKQQLITRVAKTTGYSQKEVGPVISAALDGIIQAVSAGYKVRLTGFGVFEQRVRQEREGVNPRTKERIKIASVRVPIFRPGGEFKSALRANDK